MTKLRNEVIYELYSAGRKTMVELARANGLSGSRVAQIVHREHRRRHGRFAKLYRSDISARRLAHAHAAFAEQTRANVELMTRVSRTSSPAGAKTPC